MASQFVMNISSLLFLFPSLSLGSPASPKPGIDFATKCADFATSLQLPDTKVWFTEHVLPGTKIKFPDNHVTCARPEQASKWLKYVIYEDANWDPNTTGTKDYEAIIEKNPYNVQTWEGDLSGVKNRGAKILHYHGLEDGLISSDNSQVYYDHVSRTMGMSSAELDKFYRYFRVSGGGHCSGGGGASNIGSKLKNLGGLDPDSNVLLAIVRWVEEGIPPETIMGYRYVDGKPENGVEYKRRHCRYPYRNVWDRVGDSKDPDSWSCQL